MFTAQRLFDDRVGPTDLLAHTAFLNRASAERAQGDEAGARSALAAYLVARLVERLHSLDGSPDAEESFRWQLNSTRRFTLDLPPDSTESAHLNGTLDAFTCEPAARGPVLRMSLVAYAHFLEQEGRFEEALEIIGASARTYPGRIPALEFAPLALFVGRANRHLARWEQAECAYEAACEAAVAQRDRRSELLSRLGRANVVWGKGNLPEARTLVERVIAECDCPELSDVQAKAYNDLAAVLDRQGFPIESLEANYRAFQLYEDARDRWRTVGDLGIKLKDLAQFDAARCAFALVMERSDSWTLRMNAHVELMDLESTVSNELAFRRCQQEVGASAIRMPPSMLIDFKFKSGVGAARFGQLPRARRLLEESLQLAQHYRLNAWYFRIETVLRNLDVGAPEAPERAAPPEIRQNPKYLEVERGLREAALAGAR